MSFNPYLPSSLRIRLKKEQGWIFRFISLGFFPGPERIYVRYEFLFHLLPTNKTNAWSCEH